jgi:hypothetical protein
MRRQVPLALAVLLLGPAAPAEEPRAVLERAVKAMGLSLDPAKRPAILLSFRGQADDFRAEGTIHYDGHGNRRLTMSVQGGGRRQGEYVVLTATGGFTLAAHGFWNLSPEEAACFRVTETLFTPLSLLSLLDARDVALQELDEVQIDGRPARRVRVTIEKEVASLDFDRQTGLLVRTAASFRQFGVELASHFQDDGDLVQAADVRALKGADIPEAGFVSFLRRRVRDPQALEKAAELLPQLGDEEHYKRERAAAALIDLGAPVLPVVRLGLRDRDPEVVRQARLVLDAIEKRNDPAVFRAAIRQTVHYRPKGGVPALLALVPGATPDELLDLRAALFALAETDGQLEPALVRALDDPDPKVRAVAEAVHGEGRDAAAKQPGRRIFPRDVRLPARVRVLLFDPIAAVDFEISDVQFFNSFDPKVFRRP